MNSPFHVHRVVGVVLLAAIGGCRSQPSATLTAARITELTTEQVGVNFDVQIYNRWDVPLRVSAVRGSLSSAEVDAGRPFLALTGGPAVAILPLGSQMVGLSGKLVYSPPPAGGTSIQPGDEIPYQASLNVSVTLTPNNERVELPPITHHGTLPVLAAPEVRIKSVSWTTMSWEQVTGIVTLSIRNTNKFALGPGTLTGRLALRKQEFMSADQELSLLSAPMSATIAGGTTGDVTLSASFRPKQSFDPSSWAQLIDALSDTRRLRVRGTISGATPYVPVALTFETP